MFIIRKGTFRAEIRVSTSETNIWPIHHKLWQSKTVEKNQTFTPMVIQEGKIFGTSHMINKKKYECDIV